MLSEYTQISISMCIYIEIPIDHSYTDIGMHRCSVYIYIHPAPAGDGKCDVSMSF